MSKSNKKSVDSVQFIRDRIINVATSRKTPWEGTMTDLLMKISTGRQIPERFPKSASSLRRIVDRLVPAIKKAGYNTEFMRTPDRDRMRIVRFTPISKK